MHTDTGAVLFRTWNPAQRTLPARPAQNFRLGF